MKRFLFYFLPCFFFLSVNNLSAQEWELFGNEIIGEVGDDKCGYAVSISGDGLTMATSFPRRYISDVSYGNVRVYTFDGTSWVQKGETVTVSIDEDRFGEKIDLNVEGNRLAVSSYGSNAKVTVFEWDGSDWQQMGSKIDVYPYGNVKLSSDGTRLAIGERPSESSTGQIRVFSWNGSSWAQMGESVFDNQADDSGWLLGFNEAGDNFISTFGYIARCYHWNGVQWTVRGSLLHPFDVNGGVGISADGNRISLSGYNAQGADDNKGISQVYQWNNGDWESLGNPIEGETSQASLGGSSLSLSSNGEVLALGASMYSYGSGRVYTYVFNGTQWEQVGSYLDDGFTVGFFGYSISLNETGNVIVIGAPTYPGANYGYLGKTYVYRNDEFMSTENLQPTSFRIYPNPTGGMLNIQTDKNIGIINIYDLNGRWVQTETQPLFSVEYLLSGVYLMRVETQEGIETFRIVKE
ncbi:MAG: T9SS type A sorting domain-containing protein [Flavobacteriaceae bacterium]|jgi:hypothetical protein|nr:T9SS type A sorting domain-containing protein [Flavobacteriaceae bacterium]